MKHDGELYLVRGDVLRKFVVRGLWLQGKLPNMDDIDYTILELMLK